MSTGLAERPDDGGPRRTRPVDRTGLSADAATGAGTTASDERRAAGIDGAPAGDTGAPPESAFAPVRRWIESRPFEWTITGLILLNAAIMGLETDAGIVAAFGSELHLLDSLLLSIFTAELLLRFVVYGRAFLRDPWSLFDSAIIAIAWLPATGGLSVLRALRILRILRLISVVPSLRRVVSGLVGALPGMCSIIMLLSLVFYIFAVMGTNLFGEAFPHWFGSLGGAAYSLFQIMTLDSWSMSMVRPIMEVFPYAWIYFVTFIVCTTFTVLNLFIGIIVSAMHADAETLAVDARERLQLEQESILHEIRALRAELLAGTSDEGRARVAPGGPGTAGPASDGTPGAGVA